MGIGNWPTNDSKPSTSVGPSIRSPPTGFGTIGDDDRHPVLPARAQAVGHGVHERIDARADVLEVDHERVDPVEHLCRRFPGLRVATVHGTPESDHARGRLDRVSCTSRDSSCCGPEKGWRRRNVRCQRDDRGRCVESSVDRSPSTRYRPVCLVYRMPAGARAEPHPHVCHCICAFHCPDLRSALRKRIVGTTSNLDEHDERSMSRAAITDERDGQ